MDINFFCFSSFNLVWIVFNLTSSLPPIALKISLIFYKFTIVLQMWAVIYEKHKVKSIHFNQGFTIGTV